MPAKKLITREKLLKTALKLLMDQGYEAVTIKRIAEGAGCSTQPVYLSFSGMDDLRSALIPLAIEGFEAYMTRASDDGMVRLYDMSYVRLAREEPHLFRFLFLRAHAFSEIRQALLPLIDRSIAELMDTYQIGHEEADRLHDQLWMHAHGIASMIATDFCDWDMEKVGVMLSDCKQSFTKDHEARHVHE